MKKWLLTGVTVVVMLLSMTALAFADSPVKLLVNGQLIQTGTPPVLVNGRTMAPVRWVAEALGAKVEWDESNRTVKINTPEQASLERQVRLLQQAVAPPTPGEAVKTWARGVKERNGALQYAALSPELREKRLPCFESCGWVTGTSSPWVEKFEIAGETKNTDGSREYRVKFELMTSTGPAGTSESRVTVRQYDQTWLVSQLSGDRGPVAQLEEQARGYLTEKYGRHYHILKTGINLMSQEVTGSRAEAVFVTTVTLAMGTENPADWPPQKGRIKFLEENRDRLTAGQIKMVEDKIAFWDKELLGYVNKPSEANEFLKITADLNSSGMIKADTVKIYYEDPNGDYLPVNEGEAFKTAEELEQEGYEEMRRLVGK